MAKPVSPQQLPNLARAVEDAVVLHRQGRLAEAEKIYARVLKSLPNHFDALHLLGMLRLQLGKAGEGYRLITAALKINPRSADALANFGLVLHALKRDAEALASFDQALALEPDHVEALNNRGYALLNLKRPQEALGCFDRVLALYPGHTRARVNRGNALAELGRGEEAVAEYDAALALAPSDAVALFNRGNVLRGLGRYQEAIAAYDQALAVRADYAAALNNRGLALQAVNRHQEALADFGRAVAIQRDYADAHFNEALALLTLGDLRRGFAAYEWRWKRSGMTDDRRRFGRPLWLGEYPLQRKTILIHAEQGLGDTIQFVRYVPLLARAGANVVLEVQPELKDLLARVAGVGKTVARGDALPPSDVHCPVASLPLAFKTEPATIPADIPYVTAPDERIAKWRRRLEGLARPRIAIAWAGRATHANDRNRSIPLARLAALASNDAVRLVSVQRDLRAEDAAVLGANARITHIGDELTDFSDTAAAIALTDLVVSVDTSVAHLAAAMGRPVWILVPFSPDWRWTLDGERSPWYPSARLFRQPAPGDWDSAIAQVTAELARAVAENSWSS